MSKVIESIERAQVREDIPQFKAGDTVRVHFKVIEGQRARIQVFEGIVLKRQGAGARETFTVRKQSFGVAWSGRSRCTRRRSSGSRSRRSATSTAQSCTTSAARWARRPASGSFGRIA